MKLAPDALVGALQHAGVTPDHFKAHFRADIAFNALVQALNKGVEASEEQVRAELAKQGGKAASGTAYTVRQIIFERYPATLQLAFLALLFCAAIAIPAGVLAAHRRGQTPDRLIGVFTLFGLAIPNFALGPLLILLFSIEIGLLPVSGRNGLGSYVLPAATLGAALAAILTRMVRGAMLEELSADYIRTARAKGLSTTSVLFRHGLRNALIPIITILGLQFGTLLAGTIVTETIFSWPGIGRLTVQAISARDYPLLQGCILVISLSYVLVNLLTDAIYSVVDPRVRIS
jgi:peptide/nickel transport system permease protein